MGARPASRRTLSAALPAALLVAGALVRFFRLDQRSIWFDEALALRRSSAPWGMAVLGPGMVVPPGYYAPLHAWLRFFDSDAGVRALTAICMALALILVWRLLRRWRPPGEAMATLALLAFSPFSVLYAQEARPYGVRCLFAMGALLALVNRRWALWGALLAVAGLAHTFALLLLPGAAVYVYLCGSRGDAVRAAAWGAVGAAPALAWTGVARSLGWWDAGDEVSPVPWADFLAGLAQLFGPGAWVPGPVAGPATALFAGLALAGLARAGAVLMRRTRSTARAGAVALLCFGALPPLLLEAAHRLGPVPHPKIRYAIDAQPFLLAACVAGAFAPPWPALRAGLLASLLAVEGASLAGWFAGGVPALDLPPVKKPFRDAAALIVAEARPGDAVVAHDLSVALPLARYLPPPLAPTYCLSITGFAGCGTRWWDGPVPLAATAGRARRVWFVVAPLRWHEPAVVPPWAVATLAARGALEEELVLTGLRVQRWRTSR